VSDTDGVVFGLVPAGVSVDALRKLGVIFLFLPGKQAEPLATGLQPRGDGAVFSGRLSDFTPNPKSA